MGNFNSIITASKMFCLHALNSCKFFFNTVNNKDKVVSETSIFSILNLMQLLFFKYDSQSAKYKPSLKVTP